VAHKIGHTVGKTVSLITLSATMCMSAYAQPFAEADNSVTDYAQATIEPAMTCSDLGILELRDVIALTATAIAPEDGVPAHCRVDGTIDPAITFQVNLPMTWNGRYYMVGNGGPAGQHPDTQAATHSHMALLSERQTRAIAVSRNPGTPSASTGRRRSTTRIAPCM
jgi:hypothetical protein